MEFEGQMSAECTSGDGTNLRIVINFDPATGVLTDMTTFNTSNRQKPITLTSSDGTSQTVSVKGGTTTYTTAQMNTLGLVTTADVNGVGLSC